MSSGLSQDASHVKKSTQKSIAIFSAIGHASDFGKSQSAGPKFGDFIGYMAFMGEGQVRYRNLRGWSRRGVAALVTTTLVVGEA